MDDSFDHRFMQRSDWRTRGDIPDADAVAESLRSALVVDPSPDTAERHLALMRQAAAEVAPARREAAVGGASSHPVEYARPRHRARLRVVWAASISSVAIAFSGMAAAGALPGVAQHQVSKVAAIVNIHIPDTTPKVTTTTRPATTARPTVTTARPVTTVASTTPATHTHGSSATSPGHTSTPPSNANGNGTSNGTGNGNANGRGNGNGNGTHPVAHPPHGPSDPPTNGPSQPPSNGHHHKHHRHHKPKHKSGGPGGEPPTPTEPGTPPFGPLPSP